MTTHLSDHKIIGMFSILYQLAAKNYFREDSYLMVEETFCILVQKWGAHCPGMIPNTVVCNGKQKEFYGVI